MNESEQRFQEAAARVAERRKDEPPSPPSRPLADLGTPETRTHPCACGNTITQSRIGPLPWIPSVCEECRHAASEKREQDDRQRALDAHRHRCERALASLNVPPLYTSVSFDTWQLHGSDHDRNVQARNLQIARRYAGNWPDVERLSVFAGGFGTGKGHLAWSIGKALAGTMGVSVRVAKLAAVIRDLRMAWRDKDGLSEDERLRAYRNPDLLILDEVSRHALYGAPTQHLYDIVDDRLEQDRPTIITTNEDDRGLAELLGPALLDRVQGSGGLIDFGTASWRARPKVAA